MIYNKDDPTAFGYVSVKFPDQPYPWANPKYLY